MNIHQKLYKNLFASLKFFFIVALLVVSVLVSYTNVSAQECDQPPPVDASGCSTAQCNTTGNGYGQNVGWWSFVPVADNTGATGGGICCGGARREGISSCSSVTFFPTQACQTSQQCPFLLYQNFGSCLSTLPSCINGLCSTQVVPNNTITGPGVCCQGQMVFGQTSCPTSPTPPPTSCPFEGKTCYSTTNNCGNVNPGTYTNGSNGQCMCSATPPPDKPSCNTTSCSCTNWANVGTCTIPATGVTGIAQTRSCIPYGCGNDTYCQGPTGGQNSCTNTNSNLSCGGTTPDGVTCASNQMMVEHDNSCSGASYDCQTSNTCLSGDFSVSALPISQTINSGDTATYNFTVTTGANSSYDFILDYGSSCPVGATCKFTDSNGNDLVGNHLAMMAQNLSKTVHLVVNTSIGTPVNSYTVNMTATDNDENSQTYGTSRTANVTMSVVSPLHMFGSLTPLTNSCVIASGASTCSIDYSWSTTNPQGTSAITKNPNITVATGNSGNSVPFTVGWGGETFYLYNNAVLLDQSIIDPSSVTCASGTNWDGSKCAVNPVTPITVSIWPYHTSISDFPTTKDNSIYWSTTGNPDSCTPSGASPWNSASIIPVSNGFQYQGVYSNTGTYTYNITCHKAGTADATASVSVVVSSTPLPTLPTPDLKVTSWASWAGNGRDTVWNYDHVDGPIEVYNGAPYALSWNAVSNATSCTLDGSPVSTGTTTNNTYTANSLTSTHTLSCTGPGGTQSDTVTVIVPPPPTSLTKTSCNSDGTKMTLSWNLPAGYSSSYFRAVMGDAGNWSSDPSLNDDSAGTSKTISITSGQSYHVWVHTKNPNYAWSDSIANVFSCSNSAMSGTISPHSASSCVIAVGASTCNIGFDWITTNPQATSSVTKNPNTIVATGNSGNNVPFAVKYGGETFYLYNNGQLLDQITVDGSSVTCASGSAWDGSKCLVAPVMSGSLTPPSPSCIIASGATSCNVTLNWSTLHPEGTSAVTAVGMTNVNGNSGSQSFSVPYDHRIFYLYNNGQLLDQSTATSSCASGTTWDIGGCIPSSVMSGSLTPLASSCVIAYGASTCNIDYSWSTTNPQATSSVTKNPNTIVATGNSGNNVPFAIKYGGETFYLYNNGQLLDQSTVDGSSVTCASGSAWDGSKCAPTSSPINGGWSPWGACSVTACGQTGTQSRTCTEPAPSGGGSDCFGPPIQSCSTAPCGSGPGGTISVDAPPNIYGVPEVVQGQSTVLHWNGSGSCVGTNFNTGGQPTGSVTVYPVPTNSAATITYTVTCNGVPASITVHVKKKPLDSNG